MPPRQLLPPGWAFGAAIRHARERQGLNQAQLAMKINAERATINQLETGRGAKAASAEMVAKLAAALALHEGKLFSLSRDRRLPIPDLRPGDKNPADHENGSPTILSMIKLPPAGEQSVPPPPMATPREMPLTVPILRTQHIPGGIGMRLGEQVVDYAPRPQGIIRAADVIGFRWPFADMEPAIRSGQVCYADSGRPVLVGDDVLLGIVDAESDGELIYLVRRLVSADAQGYVLEYFSPERTPQSYSIDAVRRIVHILTVNELLGIA